MAGTSLFALIDDIASLLDDIAVMTKVAAKKTAGVLGDDLALNAQQVLGLNAERELPVVWAVAVGSLKNKAILVPVALLISLFAPSLIPILLIVGGAFLCFEGVEKLVHPLLHAEELAQQRQLHAQALTQTTPEQLLDLERDKINGAIRTDFILSAEIIVISLGSLTEASASIADQIMVLVLIAVLMTVGVYGLVAGIVKLDDAGLYLARQSSRILQVLGRGILAAAPWLMKSLSVVGTVAMFIVGGGIISHNIAWLHEQSLHLAQGVALATGLAGIAEAIVSAVVDMLLGVFTGALCLALFSLGRKCWGSKA